MNSWQKIRLGDVCVFNAYTYSPIEKWKFVNYLDTSNITDNRIDTIQFIDIEKDKLPSRARRKVQKNSIIYSTVRPNQRHFGIIKKQPENFLVSTGFIVINVDDNIINADFLYYLLTQPYLVERLHIIAKQSTSMYPAINTSDMENLELKIPPMAIQKKVAEILSSLDKKIQLNTKINDNLQQQLKLLYDYWFTQFDFPDGDGNPYCFSGGAMEWNEQLKRKIPQNWHVMSLGKMCYFRNGINYSKNTMGDTSYRIVNVRNISSSSVLLDERELDELSLPCKQANKYLVPNESILIARSGIPGAPRILYKPSENIIFCGFVICATPKDNFLQYYLLLYLKQLEGSTATQTGGSILKNVSQDTLSDLLVPIPPKEVLTRFNKRVEIVYDLIHNNMAETSSLQLLRDWLLPMLMNGQVTIND